jgi:hypothetical protein
VRGVISRRVLALLAGALLLAGGGVAGARSLSSSSSATPSGAAGPSSSVPKTTTGATLTIQSIDPTKFLRASSVGQGEGGRPKFAAAVRTAAANAGCTLRADKSHGRVHAANPVYTDVPRPPTNGSHRPIWANWGFYAQPVPYAYTVHNLEHGSINIFLGIGIGRASGTSVIRMWAESPPYILILPGPPADVPKQGATITSWQRAMICKTWNGRTLAAIRTYRDTYRGTGPEPVPSLNSGASAKDLPTPALADPSA